MDVRWLGVAFAAVGLPDKDGSQEAERWRYRFQRDYGQSLLLVLGLTVVGLSDEQSGNEAQSSQKATEEKALLESLQGIDADSLDCLTGPFQVEDVAEEGLGYGSGNKAARVDQSGGDAPDGGLNGIPDAGDSDGRSAAAESYKKAQGVDCCQRRPGAVP